MHEYQTMEQIKAEAISDFVNMMIGALESGFVTDNRTTIAEIHRVAQNHIKDTYDIETPNIIEAWGEDIANLCGYMQDEQQHRENSNG